MTTPEFSRMVDAHKLEEKPKHIEANEGERAALALRFGLVSIARLAADVAFEPDGTAVIGKGRIMAAIVQPCAVTGEDLAVEIDEPLSLRFVPESEFEALTPSTDEVIELVADDPDDIPYAGHMFDLGEAVAQSLALAIDPYLTGPDADRVRQEKGLLDEAAAGPFAALAALKKE